MSLLNSLVSQKEYWRQWRFSSPSWIHRMKDWTKCCCRRVLIKYFSLWIWATLQNQNQHFVNWVLTLAPRGIDRRDFMVQTGAESAARCLSAPADASHFLKKRKFDLVELRSKQQDSRLPTRFYSQRKRGKKNSPLVCTSTSEKSHLLQSPRGDSRLSCNEARRRWWHIDSSKAVVGLSRLVRWKICLCSCICPVFLLLL